MKKFLLILFSLLSVTAFSQSGYITKDTVIASRNVTITYVQGKTDSTNIFINMNGLGEVGSDVTKNYVYGPHYWLSNGWDGGIVLGNGTHYPVYVTIQPNSGFYPPSFAKTIVDILVTRFKVRNGGINVMGLSAGAWTWETYLYYEPTLHDHTYSNMLRTVCVLGGLRVDDNSGADPYSWPAYLGHAMKTSTQTRFLAMEQVLWGGAKDTEVKSMIDSMGSSSRVAFFWTNFGGSGHTNFNDMYSPFQQNWTLSNPDVQNSNGGVINTIPITSGQNIYQWALRQNRDTSLTGTNNNPSANAGSDQGINYPAATSATLSGSASDADGTVASHTWTKVSGPAGGTITSPSNYTTTVTSLIPGVYVFRLTAVDNLGATGADDVQITVTNTNFNAPPVVDAGTYKEITLPINTVQFNASATDDSGAVSRYKITTLKAPGQATFSGAIIGSSTSVCSTVGGGQTGDSCYVKLVRDFFIRTIGAVDTIYNLAQSTTDPSDGVPTSYGNPHSYGFPDPALNITAALNKPGVDFVLVNYPTNSFDFMTIPNIMAMFQAMKDTCDLAGKKVYITTSQQRAGFSPSEEAKLAVIADSIRLRFPNNYIQFYSGFQKEGTTDYREDFDAGDNVHGNGKSQRQRGYNVIAFNLLKDLTSTSHTITNPNSNTTTVTGLSQGTYLFMVGAQDNDSLWHYDTVSVKVNAAPSNCNVASPVTYTLSTTAPGEIYIPNASGMPWRGGDTLKIPAGTYNVIQIDSFGGDPCRDIIIVNSGGQVIVTGSGMRFNKDVHHVSVLGIGSADTYGFKTVSFASSRSNHFTVRRIEAGPNPFGVGFYIKQDPYVNEPWTHYPNYTSTKITIDSCYVHDVDGEGMYIGHTYPDGDPSQGNRIPQRLDSVTISNNIVENTGWDGIQLSNARNDAKIFGNTVTNFGILDIDGQRAGIILGGNTRGKVYENTVTNGKGNGIQAFGYGTIEIYDNVVTNVGNTTKNVNGEEILYGQDYLNAHESNPKQLMNIHDNQLNYPKARGAIRFNQGANSDPTLLVDNKFCFLVAPPTNWQSLYIFLQTGFTNTNNILFCDGGANQAPTAVAGNDISILLPTSATSLNGSGSDPDGTIVSYLWTQIGGTTATIVSPNTAVTSITGLTTTGIRIFRLTVTDNGGVSSFDDITVTVTAPVNQVPVVSASSPTPTITLPTNSVTLIGSAFDPDGTIVSYSWSQQAGTSSTITTPTAPTTTVTGLGQGVFVYRFIATDNNGAAVSYDVIITVNALPDPGAPTLSPRRYIQIKR